jgi:hypothetical protein
MNTSTRDLNHKQTVREWIQGFVEGLNSDFVGLWQITGNGRLDFHFSDEEMFQYITLCVEALITAGASPVTCTRPITIIEKYGTSAAQIAQAVAIEWKGKGNNLELDLWFALPLLYDEE